MEFRDTPLADAVELMNRYGTVRIRIASPSLAGTRINGLFRADNTETFVDLLKLSFNARAERAGEEIVLDLERGAAAR